jgi:N-acetylneuraminic acid mutarotase
MFAGFINKFSDVINQTYARDVTIDGSPWRRMDDMPLSVGITHAATTVVGRKVYLCGGYYGGHPGPHIPDCFVYDHSKAPGTMQWSKIADLPHNGTAGAGMIYDTAQNALYYAGGGQRLVPGSPHPVDLNNTWKYSFDNPQFSWVASTPIPYTANHMSAVTHMNDKGQERHFFLGGQIGEYEITDNLADTFEFVTPEEKWIRRASMPIARSHATASTRPARCGFIVAGGSFNSMTRKKNRTSDISYYDVQSNSWISIGNVPVAMATPMVVSHPSGYMYFIDNVQQSFRRSFV